MEVYITLSAGATCGFGDLYSCSQTLCGWMELFSILISQTILKHELTLNWQGTQIVPAADMTAYCLAAIR